jgi:hypothetical protein
MDDNSSFFVRGMSHEGLKNVLRSLGYDFVPRDAHHFHLQLVNAAGDFCGIVQDPSTGEISGYNEHFGETRFFPEFQLLLDDLVGVLASDLSVGLYAYIYDDEDNAWIWVLREGEIQACGSLEFEVDPDSLDARSFSLGF